MGNSIASYNITITDDGSGNFTPVARRGGTAASGGTALTIPVSENSDGSFGSGATKLMGKAVMAALAACQNDRSVNG